MKLRRAALALLAFPAIASAEAPGVLQGMPQPAVIAPPKADAALPRPLVAPAPAWVDVAPLPKAPTDSAGAATIQLLGDIQVRFTKAGDLSYYASAWEIGSAQGLDGSALQVDWDPALETLTIHKYRIIRDGRTIDLLGDGRAIKVIQREGGLENAMLDGRLTATLQPEDLRVGDVVELAYTTDSHDPAMAGFSQFVAGPSDGVNFGRFRVRMLWDKDKKMQWRVFPGIIQPKLKKTAQGSELLADVYNGTAPLGPEGAPARYKLVNGVEITEFSDWRGVSHTFAPLYAKAVALGPESPVKAEAARIAAQTQDPKRRAELALKLVQDQIRYLFLGMDDGGFVPAGADQTWSRRFGDCKAKTVLLVALLNELGVTARPVLVNTKQGDLVAARLPTMAGFDHAIVEVQIAGKSYWLDGTRLGDDSLDRLEAPNYTVGLPITDAGSGLVPIVPDPLDRPTQVVSLTLDASRGIDVPALASGEMRFHGRSASDMRQTYSGYSQADRQRELRKLWRNTYDFVAPGKILTADDPVTGDFVITMTGSATMDWTRDQGTRWYEMDRSRVGWRFDIAREGELSPDAPYAFDYPDWWTYRETIILPYDGKGFRVQGEDVDRTVGDLYQFHRSITREGAKVVVEAETKAIAGELPAVRASRTRAEMTELASNGVYLRVPGDYEPTLAEKDQARREEEAEAAAARTKAARGGGSSKGAAGTR
ncbi:MAG: DUF3857 domain-containing transglutaminase family protein [Novosphingobium sp.]